jgi:small subunit ribosomal protein S21
MTAPEEIDFDEEFKPLEVKVTGSFEEALKRFKVSVQKSKILSEFKERQSFEKPSEKKRRKRREAAERRRLNEIRARQMLTGEWDKRQQRKEQKRKDRMSRSRSQVDYE